MPTPELKSVVQELVDSYSGISEVAFILMDNASSTGDEAKVMAYDDKPLEAATISS